MPRIQTTRTVRFALWALRVYLIVLLLLIVLKFVRQFARPAEEPQSPPAAAVQNSAWTRTAPIATGPRSPL
jgi:hypothetical protein